MALKSVLKPNLQIVYSVSLSVSSVLQSTLVWKWATPQQPTSVFCCVVIRGRGSYKALVNPHELQTHQSWATMRFMDGLVLRDDTAIVDHVQSWNRVSGLLWAGGCSRAAQSGLALSCAWIRPLRPSWNMGQLGTLIVWCVKWSWITSFHAAVKSNPVPKYPHMYVC